MNYFGSLLNERVVTDFVALIRTNIGSFEAGLQVQESLLGLYYNVIVISNKCETEVRS